MKYKRKKAVWGALAGMAVSLAGNIISGIINKNAKEKQEARENALAHQQNNLTAAANLANAINGSSEVVDNYNDRITYKRGGKYKRASWGTQDTNSLLSSLGGAAGSVVNAAMNANAMGNIQTVRQAPAQFQPKVIKLPTYYDRIAATQNIYRCGGKKRPVGGNIPYTPEDDFNVIRDINRKRDRRRNEEFNKDALKTAAIIAGSGLAAYPLAGYLGATAAAVPTAAGESIINYLPFAGEWVPAAYTEAAFAPMQYQTLKEYGPQILESIKSIPKSIKEKFSPTEYGPYNLREVTVSAPRKTNSKYKRK